MNDPTIDFINVMYDQRIENLKLQIRSEVAKYISSPTYNLFYKQMSELYIKQVESINIERRSCINIVSEQLYTQDFNSFMYIGEQMYEIKHLDKYNYDYIVDKAFCIDTPLSIFKFKYA
jgi:hypothetical protein